MGSWLPALRTVVSAAAILLTLGSHLALRRGVRWLDRATTAALAVLAVVAVVDYTEPQWSAGRYFNSYEFYHYYTGTKYAPELGYTGLYAASVIAQDEMGITPLPNEIRDLQTSKRVAAAEVCKRPEVWKARFSDERWQEFKEDIRFFRARVSATLWERMLKDKGYNASPVWTAVGGMFSTRIAVTQSYGLKSLPLLDVVLFAGALAAVVWAFGMRAALLVLVLFCNHYVTSQPVLKAAFLRLEWLACLLTSVAMLKKGRHEIAGALTAYASMVRVFPAIFAFGIGVKLLWDLVRTRSCERRHLRYMGSFAATGAVLFGLSLLATDNGLRYWAEFVDKVMSHDGALVPARVGFKYVFLMAWDGRAPGGGRLSTFLRHWAPLYGVLLLAAMATTAYLLRRLQDYQAQALGYIAAFVLVAPTYYYQVMLLAPILICLEKLEDRWMCGAVVTTFATSSLMGPLYKAYGRTYLFYFLISCLLLGQVVLFAAIAWRQGRTASRGDATSAALPLAPA